MPNQPKTAKDRQLILSRIKAENKQGCWIWNGPLSEAGHPIQSFEEPGNKYSYNGRYIVGITRFTYETAFRTALPERTPFHYCTIDNRCVNPLHNYPNYDCKCDRCKRRVPATPRVSPRLRNSEELKEPRRNRRKPQPQWVYKYVSPEGQELRVVFPTKDLADTYAFAHIQNKYHTVDILAAQQQHGFQWSVTTEERSE